MHAVVKSCTIARPVSEDSNPISPLAKVKGHRSDESQASDCQDDPINVRSKVKYRFENNRRKRHVWDILFTMLVKKGESL